MSYDRELQVAILVANQAGQLAQQLQSRPLERQVKADGSLVTSADPEVEDYIWSALHQRSPADGFLGEESPEIPGKSGRRWIVDPIDGTVEFAAGKSGWTVMIALEDQGTIVLGVIRDPVAQVTAYAEKGKGAWMMRGDERSQLRIPSRKRSLSGTNLMYCLYTRYPFQVNLEPLLKLVRRDEFKDDLFALLSGEADILLVQGLAKWDIAAQAIVIREAGGIAEERGGLFIAANPHLFPLVIKTLGL